MQALRFIFVYLQINLQGNVCVILLNEKQGNKFVYYKDPNYVSELLKSWR